MKIQLSRHVLEDKLPLLKRHGFVVTKQKIKEVIKNPDHIDEESDFPKVIASKDFDEKHVLRIVYKVEDGISFRGPLGLRVYSSWSLQALC